MFTHAPRVGGAVWDSGTFLPYGGPHVLLPTKTSQAFSHFSDSSPFIEFPCVFNGVGLSLLRCGYI